MLLRRFDLLGYRVPVLAPMVVAVAIMLWIVASSRPTERPGLTRATIPVGDAPQELGFGPLGLWVANGGDRTIQPIDLASGRSGESIRLQRLPGGLAVTEDAIWVGSIEGSAISKVVPAAAPVQARVSEIVVGRTPQAVAVGDGMLWVASFDEGSISVVDVRTGTRTGDPILLKQAFPSALAVGFGSVWVTDVVANTLLRIDEDTGEVEQTIEVGDSPTGIALDPHGVWVANFNDSTVTHIDPATDQEVGQPVVVGGEPGGIAAGEGYIWVTRPEDDSVIRIDPSSSRWTGEVFEVGDSPHGVLVAAGSVWVANQEDDTVTRLTPES